MFRETDQDAHASSLLNDDELGLVLGGAGSPQPVQPSRMFAVSARPAAEALELFRQRLPVINPERLRSGLGNLAHIHPDLEDPFPKGPPDPQEPPIPPDLEDPFPPRPPTELPAFRR